MSINASYEYLNAEKAYNQAISLEEKIAALEEMIRTCPGHKGAENLRADLRTRIKKLLEKKEKSKKVGKTTRKAIRKEGYQVVLLGFTGKGKSSLLSKLTNTHPKISPYSFTTKEPEIGTLDYQGVKAQIIDLPSIGSENFDLGIINTADLILIVITSLDECEKISPYLSKAQGKIIIVMNKSESLSSGELRKLNEKIKSKRLNAIITSCYTGYGIDNLKEAIFNSMNIIRVYTKEPHRLPSNIPVILPQNATVKDVAESIRKGFSITVKETRLTGPSSKFPNQKVGLSHVLKDKDIVEFHTR